MQNESQRNSLMGKRNPKKYGIVINAAKCIDCKACTIACKVENNLPTHRIVN
jgi:Fe-S-cluster-containing dehydrogenase component